MKTKKEIEKMFCDIKKKIEPIDLSNLTQDETVILARCGTLLWVLDREEEAIVEWH